MKKYLVLILAIALFACSQEKGFKIKVDLDGAEGQVVLEEYTGGEMVALDTADIVEGVAVLEGAVAVPTACFLSVVGKRARGLVFVENKPMTITGHADSLRFVKVTGSVSHDEYQGVNSKIEEIRETYMTLYRDAMAAGAAGDTAKANELKEQVDILYKSIGTLQEDFIKENPASYVAPFYLSRIQYDKSAVELDSLINTLDPKMMEVQTIIDLKEHIAKMKSVEVGKTAPDFTQNDKDGNPIKFSDIYSKNKLTLLDFWASWCSPCRGENPNVVKVFNANKDKGFSVFGVSLDEDKNKWLEAIEKDKLTWEHVSDLGGWKNAASKLYAVNSIPSSLLIDKNGKIVAKNKRGEELGEFVSEFLSK